MLIYDPETNLFTVTNHKSYVVTLPIVVTCGLTPLCVIIEAVPVNCIVL